MKSAACVAVLAVSFRHFGFFADRRVFTLGAISSIRMEATAALNRVHKLLKTSEHMAILSSLNAALMSGRDCLMSGITTCCIAAAKSAEIM